MATFIGDLGRTLSLALGFRRYTVLGTTTAATTVLAAAYALLQRWLAVSWLPEIPLPAFFAIALCAILFFVTLVYAAALQPKLDMSFSMEHPWVTTVDTLTDVSNETTLRSASASSAPIVMSTLRRRELANWYRIQTLSVRDGRPVKGCRVLLTNVEFWEDGHYKPTLYSASHQLHWSQSTGDGYGAVDISFHERRFVDVFMTAPSLPAIKVKWKTQWQENDQLFDRLGRYRFTLAAVSEEAAAVTRRLVVDWNGQWDAVKVAMEK